MVGFLLVGSSLSRTVSVLGRAIANTSVLPGAVELCGYSVYVSESQSGIVFQH